MRFFVSCPFMLGWIGHVTAKWLHLAPLTLVLTALLFSPTSVMAQPGEIRSEAFRRDDIEVKKRALPDYDGRPDASEPGEVAIWVPRILLSPLYLVAEYIIRRPLGWLVSTAEEREIPNAVFDFFTFGDDGQIAVVPTALFELGFNPSVGLYFRWNDVGHPDNKVRLSASTGGTDWNSLRFALRREPDSGEYGVQLQGQYVWRPDGLIHGIGPKAKSQETDFRYRRLDTELSGFIRPFRSSEVHASVLFRDMTIWGDGGDDDTVDLQDRIAAGQLAAPAGYPGYTAMVYTAGFSFDTRKKRPAPGGGIRLDTTWRFGHRLDGPNAGDFWLQAGGHAGVYLDLSKAQHVVSLAVHAHDSIHVHGQTPFPELFEPSSMEVLRGFRPGRLYGESLAAIVFEYQWPISSFFDGFFHAGVGNVYGRHFDDLSFEDARFSTAFGLRTNDSRDHALEILIGSGTERFEEGAAFEEFRFLIGGTTAF